jgi:deoxyribonuclease V
LSKVKRLHRWDVTYEEAIELQNKLKNLLVNQPYIGTPIFIGGADVSYRLKENRFLATIVVLKYPELEIIDKAFFYGETKFPYIPGLLSFRELPPIIQTYEKLNILPDILVLDGQGIAHPRLFGLAAHVGVFLSIPTIGCAKKKLCGAFVMPDDKAGSSTDLVFNNLKVGKVVRTKLRCKPVFVSPGHLMDLESSQRIVLSCCKRYRLPEPTRIAHLLSKAPLENFNEY